VRLVHLGLGNFFRAHQAWYTEHAPDAGDWGYTAFSGRSSDLARSLEDQGGLYTLMVRAPENDEVEVVSSVCEAHGGADHDSWLAAFGSPDLAAVTITVTEAGYCRGADGRLDAARSDVAADVERLRGELSAPVTTAPARLVAGLAARRRAGAGPVALIPCDNVPGNGSLARQVLDDLTTLIDPALAEWISESTSVVTTVVDRITPRAGADETATVLKLTGRRDDAVVVTEPFSEWVLSGVFPAGRPSWEQAGAILADDVTPYENRKLWLLNGAHSLLAYAGPIRGHTTVAEAVADDVCRGFVEDWWAEAARHLDQPAGEIASYRAALLRRFANPRMHDQLARIAEDGSQKLPIRVLPVLRAECGAGRLPPGATRILAAWICHLRGSGGPVHDVRAAEVMGRASGPLPRAVRGVLEILDPTVAEDADVVTMAVEQCHELQRCSRMPDEPHNR